MRTANAATAAVRGGVRGHQRRTGEDSEGKDDRRCDKDKGGRDPAVLSMGFQFARRIRDLDDQPIGSTQGERPPARVVRFDSIFLEGKDNLRFTFDAAWLERSPAGQNRTGFVAGQTGLLIRTQITVVY